MKLKKQSCWLCTLGIAVYLSGLWCGYFFRTTDHGRQVVVAIKKTSELRIVATKQRILFMAASYTTDQFLFLQKFLDVAKDHCNSGWNVTVHLQVANGLDYDSPRFAEFQDRLHCVATDESVRFILDSYEKIGFGLNSRHRIFVKNHLADFDYFVYGEEDMLLSVSHLNAYISAEEKLKKYLPTTWHRWEDSTEDDSERVTWEYLPHQIHAVDMGPELGKYLVTNNLNQAIYVLSQERMIDLENRCSFLSETGQNQFYKELRRAMDKDWKYMAVGVSEWSSSFQQVLQCGLRRIVPADHFQDFMIHHSANKAQLRRSRKELLNARDWMRIVKEKVLTPITADEAFNKIIREQYNLHLMDPSKLRGVKWSTFDLES